MHFNGVCRGLRAVASRAVGFQLADSGCRPAAPSRCRRYPSGQWPIPSGDLSGIQKEGQIHVPLELALHQQLQQPLPANPRRHKQT